MKKRKRKIVIISVMVVTTGQGKAVIDITENVQSEIGSNISGICFVNLQHTTAALTTADLDPGTDQDFLDFLATLVPDIKWRHPHNPAHTPDHLLSSLIGASVSVPVQSGKLMLGTWQRIVLVEFDGPRERQLDVTVLESKT